MGCLNRRTFVTRTGLLAAGALGASLLQACAPAATSAPAAGGAATAAPGATGGGLKLPTYVPFEGPTPDLAGNPKGLDPAYFKFPSNLFKTVTTPPGDGSTINAITYLTLAPPPPPESNAAWQAVNRSINATLQMDQVSAADYAAKVNVVVAGNDLPNFIYNPTINVPWGVISGLPQFVKAKCTDPTLGLYSPTAAAQGPLAQDALLSGVSDIVQSRRPLTDLDSLLAEWRTKAGDKIRGEFQAAIAAAKA